MSGFAFPLAPFSSAVRDCTGGNIKVQRNTYASRDEVPVIDQGQDFIAGYTQAENQYQGTLPILLFGDHTRIFKYVDFPFALGADGVKALEPQEGFDAKFLFYFFRSVHIPSAGYSRHFKFLKEVQVPKPPLSEQRRIVDLLSRAEGIVRLRREAEKKAAELIPALFFNMFGDPTANPKGWPTRPLRELVAFMSGGTPSKARQDFWEGDLPWVSPKDMKRMAITDAIDHVNRKILTETNIKLVPVGSLLIVVRGMILIHTVPVAISRAPLTINQDMKALTPQIDTNSTYLLWLMKVSQPKLLNLVSTAAHGTKKLETERLEALPIPLPPLEAQAAFANQVAQIESIQTQQSAAFAKAKATFDALLAHTFRN